MCVYGGWGAGEVLKYENWYICATEGLKTGGMGSSPLLKIGGFQNRPTREKGVLELKITRKHIFENEHFFELHRSKNLWSL